MSNWFKTAGYNYVEDVQDRIWSTMELLKNCPQKQCVEEYAKLETAFRNLRRAVSAPKQPGQSFYSTDLNKLLINIPKMLSSPSLTQALATARTDMGQYQQQYDTTFNQGRIGTVYWENDPTTITKVVHEPSPDKTQPGRIVLTGLKLPRSREAQQIVAGMGDKLTTDGNNTYLRGTSETWRQFLSLAHWVFSNQAFLNEVRFSPPLPSEKRFNPEYAEPEAEPFKPQVFEAYLLNAKGLPTEGLPPNRLQETWEVGNKKLERLTPQGIRLMFAPDDPNFYIIRDYIVKEAGFNTLRLSPQQGIIDVFEKDGVGWANISGKLQQLGYPTAGERLNALIAALTGATTSESNTVQAEELKSKPLGEDMINNAIARNRFDSPTIGDRFGIQGPVDKQQFFQILQQNYRGAFNVPPDQQAAQMEGMWFASTHGASVLADEPGSGKTAQSIVAADIVRNQNQKVLVVTPNVLIAENWTGPKAKGPMLFCGHNRESVVVLEDEAHLATVMSNPSIIWVIVPKSLFTDEKKGPRLGRAIGRYSQSGAFASCIVDEIQTIKSDESNTYESVRQAIMPYGETKDGSRYGIKHRIGLSGTPADNDPGDIYTLFRLLRHPLLYHNTGLKQDGRTDLIIRQNQKGFLSQFVGGGDVNEMGGYDPIIMKAVSLSEKIREGGADRNKSLSLQWEIGGIVKRMIKWAAGLQDSQKLQILDLFAGTFLRRNKQDIRKDAPGVRAHPMPVAKPEGVQLEEQGRHWHTKSLRRMAIEKIPMTVGLATQFLQADENQKVFILTKHPDVAKEISKQLNQIFGDGACTYISGQQNDDDLRAMVADTFRDQNSNGLPPGYLPRKKTKLRAVVYTMQIGAVGLNFAIATKAIFNDLDWNPSKNEQGVHRVNRIDSTQTADIYYPYFEGTYDEEMFHRVERKNAVNGEIANAMREAHRIGEGTERIRVAEEYIKNLIKSTMYDLELSGEQVQQLNAQIDMLYQAPVAQEIAAGSWWKQVKLANEQQTQPLYPKGTRVQTRQTPGRDFYSGVVQDMIWKPRRGWYYRLTLDNPNVSQFGSVIPHTALPEDSLEISPAAK